MSFADLKKEIENAPVTWLPALFCAIVKACLYHDVFSRGAMSRYCSEEEKKFAGNSRWVRGGKVVRDLESGL